jgi:hypothetical protein
MAMLVVSPAIVYARVRFIAFAEHSRKNKQVRVVNERVLALGSDYAITRIGSKVKAQSNTVLVPSDLGPGITRSSTLQRYRIAHVYSHTVWMLVDSGRQASTRPSQRRHGQN